ncbi:hypothetical protein [Bifidobacterium actinocoloniiforme]|uniref:hypothetical protein n=1 Tax=Bifidobacterium actinocoloniiforme TaxID=638619 RepID=UPI000A5335A7|nr:hypothetical protein [Bifidobacterium actinocoloniiforme]
MEDAQVSLASNGKLHLSQAPALPVGSNRPTAIQLVTGVNNEALITSWAHIVLHL